MSALESAAAIAREMHGRRSGDGYLVRCPVAGHGAGRGDRRPSLFIKDGATRLLVHCFSGCDAREVLDALRARGLVELATETTRVAKPTSLPLPRAVADEAALEIWRTSIAVEGTLAGRYLGVHRGLRPPYPASLRFAPALRHDGTGLVLPAMVAAVQAVSGEITGVQTTFLAGNGAKAALRIPRWTYGLLGEGAVRLGSSGGVVLGLAEGIEDALAASQLSQPSQLSCWACLGSSRMHRVALPASIPELHIFADDDEPGRRAADRTTSAHLSLGRRVFVHLPPKGSKDWGDVVRPDWRRAA